MLNNIIKILSGNGLAQLIQFSSLFFLARLYSPEEFSLLAVVQSLSTLVAIILTGQLHNTIPLHSKETKRNKVFSAIVVQISILFIFLVIFSKLININSFFLGVMLGSLLALYNTNISFSSAAEKFKYLSLIYIIRAILIVTSQFAFSIFEPLERLVYSVLLAELLVQLLFLSNYKKVIFKLTEIKNNLIEMYKSRVDFYVFGSLSELVAVGAFFLPLYFINYRFGESVSGNYGMASRLVWAPAILVTSSVCQVLYSKLGKLEHNDAFDYIKNLKMIPIVMIAISIASISFYLDPLYRLILGDGWELAVKMLPWLILWALIYMIGSIYRLAYRIFAIQRYLVLIDILYLFVVFLLFYFSSSDVLVDLKYVVGVSLLNVAITIFTLFKIGKDINVKKNIKSF